MKDFVVTAGLGVRIISLAAAFGVYHITVTELVVRIVDWFSATTGVPEGNFTQGNGSTGTTEVPEGIVWAVGTQCIQFIITAKELVWVVAFLTTAARGWTGALDKIFIATLVCAWVVLLLLASTVDNFVVTEVYARVVRGVSTAFGCQSSNTWLLTAKAT